MNLSGHRTTAAVFWTAALLLPVTLAGCSESGGAPAEAQASTDGRGHAKEATHEGQANHGGHEKEGHEKKGHAGEKLVSLTAEEIDEYGIQLRTAGAGTVAKSRTLPGEITLNPTREAEVTPRVPGVVREVGAIVGDHVEEGDVLAVLTSRELAQAKSEYLAALTRLELARTDLQRVETLWRQKIAPKAKYLAAKQALKEARLAVRLAERELDALGLSQEKIANLPEQPDKALARYELTAPINGEVVKRSITKGEVLPKNPAKPAFVVADLSTVWVHLTVYPKDLAAIQTGQTVVITAQEGRLKTTGTIDYVSPIVGEETRTATARVVLENPKGRWKPGLFVTARVRTEKVAADVVVPQSALHTIEGQTVVFVKTDEGFKPQPVEVGQSSGEVAEIVSGLQPGQKYVAAKGFILKAELLKGTFSGHSH